MAPVATKRRRVEDEVRPKKKKKVYIKKQKDYHSSSEDEDGDELGVNGTQRASDAPKGMPKRTILPAVSGSNSIPVEKLASERKSILKQSKAVAEPVANEAEEIEAGDKEDAEELLRNTALNAMIVADEEDLEEDDLEDNDEPDLDDVSSQDDEDDDDEDVASESEASMTSSQATRTKKKRNDPTAFATSISKILDTKLSTSKRQDPVLSRSKTAAEANKTLADSKLEQKARAQIRAEKRHALEKGRVKDVLGFDTPDVDTGGIVEQEKRLKKTAQRGVVRLFNAVRAAQVKAEEAQRQAKSEGVVGMQKREERVNEMSKQGFLDLISSGGKQNAAAAAVVSS